jgi:hypothetical protein
MPTLKPTARMHNGVRFQMVPDGGFADAKNLSQNNAVGQESRTPQYKAMSAVSQVGPELISPP